MVRGEDSKPILWLVSHLVGSGRIEEAEAHVEAGLRDLSAKRYICQQRIRRFRETASQINGVLDAG